MLKPIKSTCELDYNIRMLNFSRSNLVTIFTFICALVILSSCGNKGPLTPPTNVTYSSVIN